MSSTRNKQKNCPFGNMTFKLFLFLCLLEMAAPTTTPQQFYGIFKNIMEKFLVTGENLINVVYSKDFRYCAEDLISTLEAIRRKDQWTIQLLDSFGKASDTYIWPGTESLCLSVVPEIPTGNGTIIHPFTTHYCTLRMIYLSIGVCLPTTCTEEVANELFTIYQEFTGDFQFVDLQCVSELSFNYQKDTYAYTCLLICLILLVIVILGTTYDVILRFRIQYKADSPQHNKSSVNEATFNVSSQNNFLREIEDADDVVEVIQPNTKREEIQTTTLGQKNFKMKLLKEVGKLGWLGHILFSFSALINLKRLFSVEPEKGQLQCLHGLRVLAILTVIYAHTWAYLIFYIGNVITFVDVSKTASLAVIIYGIPFAVDTFFLISGLLVTYSYLKNLKENKSISWFKFYLDRLLRLSPSYWFTIFVIVFGLFLRQKFGPFDIPRTYLIETCKENWWRSILYVSNSIPYTDSCYLVDWYLAVDMQFHWLSPIVLYVIINYKRLAIGLASVTILTSSVITALLVKKYDIRMTTPTVSMDGLNVMKGYQHFIEEIYIKPYCRITPFIFGMMVGWLLFKTKHRIDLNKIQVMLFWCLAIASSVAAMMIPYYFILSVTTTSIYIAFMYILWSIAMSIIIILCSTGNARIINSFLSWSGWLPFSRLAYGVFLLHSVVLLYFNDVKERSIHLSFPFFNMNFMCVVISCFVFSTLLYLTIERPFENLRRITTTTSVKLGKRNHEN